MFYVIVTAIGLFLILEGILPFASPKTWRKMVARMMEQKDKSLQTVGLTIMIVGVLLVVFAHHFLRI